jgi:tRNA(Ile)-lysidine synthase
MLKQSTINLLKSSKNLLAFSAGVDSTALFYLLVQNDVQFDIAIVDYNIRSASKDEVSYARELADKSG